MIKKQFRVQGMHCVGCAMTVDGALEDLAGVKSASTSYAKQVVDVVYDETKVTEKNSQGTVTQVVEYIYDVFDRRIGRKIDTSAPFDMANAVIERYVLDDIHNGLTSDDGGNVVLDFVDPDGSGAQAIAMSKRYLYGEAVDQLFAQEDLSKTLGDTSRNLWPLVDHLGTVRDLAKQDGTIAAHFKYDSFGNVTSGDTSKTRYLFTSREFDTATKLQYNRARYYDAAVGRWISEDPLGFAAGDANVGRYVGNATVDFIDPSGLDWTDWPIWRPGKRLGLWISGLPAPDEPHDPPPPYGFPPYRKWQPVPRRWPGPNDRGEVRFYPITGVSRVNPLPYTRPHDQYGFPVGVNTWKLKDYISETPYPIDDFDFGCGSWFTLHMGLYPDRPWSFSLIPGHMVFQDMDDALKYLKEHPGGLGIIENSTPYEWPVGSNGHFQGPIDQMPEPTRQNGHNFRFLSGTPDDWWWVHAGSGRMVNPDYEVIHNQAPLPGRDSRMIIVVPGAPTQSPIPSKVPEDFNWLEVPEQ